MIIYIQTIMKICQDNNVFFPFQIFSCTKLQFKYYPDLTYSNLIFLYFHTNLHFFKNCETQLKYKEHSDPYIELNIGEC